VLKPWTIPDYDLRYYLSRHEDVESIITLKTKVLDDDLDVTTGVKFPGFQGPNTNYMNFYRQEFSSVFTPPRGNLNADIVVCGIAPGYSPYSFKEPKWLLGSSSKILHKLLIEHNVYPYFTNVFKKPFLNNEIRYVSEELLRAVDILYQEILLIAPKQVIFLGKYNEYSLISHRLTDTKVSSLNHPSYINRTNSYSTWSKRFGEIK
jgi:uracil-DNA glycosylase family 4